MKFSLLISSARRLFAQKGNSPSMKVIVVSDRLGSRTLKIDVFNSAMLAIFAFLLLFAIAYLGYYISSSQKPLVDPHVLAAWQAKYEQQHDDLVETKQQAQEQLDAMAVRLAQLQARIMRLDALGERVTSMTKLDHGEFDFSAPPPVGGPEAVDQQDAADYDSMEFMEAMDRLDAQIADRSKQLGILQALMANRQLEDAGYVAGRPIKKGWMSSSFGKRTDPFNGKLAWHKGVDFAGKKGSEIVAVASGVVTWSDERYGYGNMVEINHGNGFVTRYAHNTKNLVQVGDVVKKGQDIALMGSSGRSTGPHVHFEVYKDGRAVDPSRYIYRAKR